jgi:hypothetical protein
VTLRILLFDLDGVLLEPGGNPQTCRALGRRMTRPQRPQPAMLYS